MPTLATPGNQGSGAGPGELLKRCAVRSRLENAWELRFLRLGLGAYDKFRFLPPATQADLTNGNL